MGPKGKHPSTGDLFRQPLLELINEKHPLVRLAELIDWSIFETRWSAFFPSKTGRPATPPRLIAGLLYLQHTFARSDEELVWAWVENPYWQHFCGETYFQHEPPIDPSSLTRWRASACVRTTTGRPRVWRFRLGVMRMPNSSAG